MSKPDDVAELLNMYATRADSARIPFEGFVQFCRKLAERRQAQEERFVDLSGENVRSILVAHLRALSDRGRASVSFSDGEPTEIFFAEYYIELLRKKYRLIEEHPSTPFPTEDNVDFHIPSESIQPVGVSEEFTKWIAQEADEGPPRILRLQFPDTLTSILVVSDMVPEQLLHVSIQKIRLHLRNEKQAGYMHHKLLGHFPNREIALRDMLNQLLTTPRESMATVMHPTDFTYHFWTQVCSNIIKDLRTGNQETPDNELGLGQAAYMLGYYNTHFRGADQKKREIEAAEKLLSETVAKKHEPFSFADIAETKDDKGNPISKRISRERIAEFIQERLEPDESQDLPEIMLVHGGDGHDYYLTTAHALGYILKRRSELADSLRNAYTRHFYKALRQDQPTRSMKSDEAFVRHIGREVAARDPVFAGLLKYEMISLLARQAPADAAYSEGVKMLISESDQQIRPLDEVFELDRKKLIKDAELMLPFYLATPVFRAIARLIRRLAGKGRQATVVEDVGDAEPVAAARDKGAMVLDEADGSRNARAARDNALSESGDGDSAQNEGSRKSRGAMSSTEYRKKVQEIAREFVPEGQSLPDAMEDLIEQWNPLIDETAKKNLVEDVNSLVRDFLRRMRAGFRVAPPGPDRIRKMAEELAQKDAFSKIRRKEALKRYIELYMLKLLGKR